MSDSPRNGCVQDDAEVSDAESDLTDLSELQITKTSKRKVNRSKSLQGGLAQ
jgi:hypothetical protein